MSIDYAELYPSFVFDRPADGGAARSRSTRRA